MTKTLADYHLTYPARPGDTIERFARYEAFCLKEPYIEGDNYHSWYARLTTWMETNP